MFYKINHIKSFNLNDEISEQRQLILDCQAIQQGVIADFGVNEFSVLLVIMSHVGVEEPITFDRIAELTGLSRRTIATIMKKLKDAGIVLKDAKTYKIIEDEIKSKNITSKDIIVNFCDLYYQTYGVHYNPTWAKDSALVKTKLMANFDTDTIMQVVEVAVVEYNKRWATKQYPRPTIGMLCTWLFNSALGVIQEKNKLEQQVAERMNTDVSKYDKLADDILDQI